MKYSSTYLAVITLLFFFSCSATKHTADSNYRQPNNSISPNKDRPSNISLAEMLRRIPGVQVKGSGNNVSVKVGGVTSMLSNTDPLYVVDGRSAGTSYSQVAATVYPNNIKSINVLKGADATIYGVRGANGVIVINTN